jgi:predicted dehydrogenase
MYGIHVSRTCCVESDAVVSVAHPLRFFSQCTAPPPAQFDTDMRRMIPLLHKRFTLARNDQIGIGIIGIDSVFQSSLLPELTRLRGILPVGLYSGDISEDMLLARRYLVNYVAPNWRDLLLDPTIDAIFVTAEGAVCADICAGALDAGKAVFVTRASMWYPDELRRVLRAWKSGSRFLMINWTRRFAPLSQYLIRHLDTCGDNRVVYARANYASAPASPGTMSKIGLDAFGNACELIDLAQVLANGIPTRVFALAENKTQLPGSDISLSATLLLDNHARVSLALTRFETDKFPSEYVEVFGEHVAGIIDDFRTAFLLQTGAKRRSRSGKCDRGSQGALWAFLDALWAGRMQPVSIHEYAATMLTVTAMQKSVNSGEAVKIETKAFLADVGIECLP